MLQQSRKWTVTLEQDGEDLVLPFSDEMLELLGWTIGDTIEWIDNNDGTFTLIKKEENVIPS